IRVLIADDHSVLRAGLRMLLELHRDIAVVGEAADGVEVSRRAKELTPDIVLLDLSMPGPRSGTVIRDVLRASPKTRVLILTMHDDAAYLRSALAAGAAGFLVKKVADSELLSAIRAVHAGRTFVDLTHTAVPLRASRGGPSRTDAQPPKRLSKREREVLRLLAEGHSNQQIAGAIHLSVKTVETYRTRLSVKLGLKGRAELYRFAAESGILDAESPRRARGD
ncbi:MAG TPA: response regulator transcription factor, partial [Gemmatimonadaceae bacterium]|nr:response regulator transcription factor [Gemmatimonadaceae bacterium]